MLKIDCLPLIFPRILPSFVFSHSKISPCNIDPHFFFLSLFVCF